MKGLQVKFETDEWSGNVFIGTVLSEPYPKIFPQQLHVRGSGGTHVGAASTTCVIILREDDELFRDIPVSDIKEVVTPGKVSFEPPADAKIDKLREAAKAALRYDEAIQSCANSPEKMASFCSAEGARSTENTGAGK